MIEAPNCATFESLAVLYAAGELESCARASVEEHARTCPDCNALLQSEMALAEIFASSSRINTDEPAQTQESCTVLLAHCRRELSKALNEAAQPRGWRQWLTPRNWSEGFRVSVNFHPAWSLAALLLVAAVSGFAGWEGVGRISVSATAQPVMTISAAQPVSDQELATMGIDGLRWEPRANASPSVEVSMRTDRPVTLRGSTDDSEIRRVLSYVVENGSRFDPGVRLDSLELLRTQASNPRVNDAIRRAAQQDPNPAVRLRALESLRDLGANPDVRSTMLQALSRDDNSGVRIEAVNGLLAALEQSGARTISPDAGALEILRDRMQNDPNNYVRLRSATALAQFASERGNLATAQLPDEGSLP